MPEQVGSLCLEELWCAELHAVKPVPQAPFCPYCWCPTAQLCACTPEACLLAVLSQCWPCGWREVSLYLGCLAPVVYWKRQGWVNAAHLAGGGLLGSPE